MSWLQIVLVVYGLVNIGGGAFAFQKYQSSASLMAGVGAGLVVLILTGLTFRFPAMAYRLLGVAAIAMAGFWGYRLYSVAQEGGKTMMPMMNLVLAVVVFACLGLAHMAAVRKRRLAPGG